METASINLVDKIKEQSLRFQGLSYEVAKVIVGQQEAIDMIALAVLCSGHVLLEGVPGIAKTTMIKAATKALGLNFNRIQFTPDLLPSDVIGSLVYNPKTLEFETKKGPIFANLILADEINRAPAKVQSALLEAMQEQQVTIGTHTFKLDEPFIVFATQNPIEQEGTYRLPEAQLDRFMFKLVLHYPTIEQERQLMKRSLATDQLQPIMTRDDLDIARCLAENVYVDEKIVDYITRLVFATRQPTLYGLKECEGLIRCGVSPRATLALFHASKAYAFLKKRHFVTPDDIKMLCPAIFRHRLILTYEAEADSVRPDDVIQKILSMVPTP